MDFFNLNVPSGDSASEVVKKKFTCGIHGAYEAEVLKFAGEEIGGMCPECMKLWQKKSDDELKDKQKKAHIEFCKSCNIEPEFYDYTIDSYQPKTESQKKAKLAVQHMMKTGFGKIILLGSCGTGKTMLASIAAKHFGGKVYTMYEISTMIRQSYTPKAEKSELEIVNELASIPFLAIDELGRTKGSSTEQNWLSYILDKRHTRRLPFMLLSNGHFKSQCKEKNGCPRCFENFIDSDVLSRLQQDSALITIHAPDIRANKSA